MQTKILGGIRLADPLIGQRRQSLKFLDSNSTLDRILCFRPSFSEATAAVQQRSAIDVLPITSAATIFSNAPRSPQSIVSLLLGWNGALLPFGSET